MTDDNGNGPRRANHDLTKFKWLVIAGVFSLVMILGTIQELLK